MWKCDPNQLKLLMSAGERYALLMDRIIRAEAALYGVRQDRIQTQIRVNITDGGVDAAVHDAIPKSLKGWFDVPTCWQYKAQPAVAIDDKPRKTKQNDLQLEIHKPHVTDLINRGYGFRFCILGDLTNEKVENWEAQLLVEARKINAAAAEPRVVHGGFLPDWIESFPAVLQSLVSQGSAGVLHLEAWRRNITKVVPQYVANSSWNSVQEALHQHLDFSFEPSTPCFALGGAAGVGKTRFVFETVSALKGAAGLTLYASDEQDAKSIAVELANGDGHAWLIADECSDEAKFYLNENLKGSLERVRVICINNVKPLHESPDGDVWLQPTDDISTILIKNFSDTVPPDSCRKYALLSKGFVRLAADMCDNHSQIAAGEFGGILSSVGTYAKHRLNDEWLPSASLISLFPKVGFQAEVQDQIESLSTLSGISVQDFKDMVRSVKDSPGFVVQQGRYCYVSPDIIARALHAEGWVRWICDDLQGFLDQLPPDLLQPFIDRVGDVGGKEARAQLGDTFRIWSTELTVETLANPRTARMVRTLIESNVNEYLPVLQSLLINASDNELRKIGTQSTREWSSSRRTLVWFLESLSAFPEFFIECEDCLFALARGENESQISNNATQIWSDLYSIFQSGSALPYVERFAKLKCRINCGNRLDLCVIGLKSTLKFSALKFTGPPIAAGKLRPSSWTPTSTQEVAECYREALSVIPDLLHRGDAQIRMSLCNALTESVNDIFDCGAFDQFRDSVESNEWGENERRQLIRATEQYRDYSKPQSESERELVNKVDRWLDEIRPTDVVERLRSFASRQSWDAQKIDRAELQFLADSMIDDPNILISQLEWLGSSAATSADLIGGEIGQRDSDSSLGLLIVADSKHRDSAGLLRGYINGAVAAGRTFTDEFKSGIDKLQIHNPLVAADSIRHAGDSLDVLNRMLSLVATGNISARVLSGFAYHYGDRELTDDEMGQVLCEILQRESTSKDGSIGAAIELLGCLVSEVGDRNTLAADLIPLAWEIVRAGSENTRHQDAFNLDRVVKSLSAEDPNKAFEIWSTWLVHEEFELNRKSAKRLAESAEASPDQVMAAFGTALLDEKKGYRLQTGIENNGIVPNLPTATVIGWLEKHGKRAAELIARHLPLPHFNDSGEPAVPDVTLGVLNAFPNDAVVGGLLAASSSGFWRGNASERFLSEARLARALFAHNSQQVRLWAKDEYERKMRMAQQEVRMDEEKDLPS